MKLTRVALPLHTPLATAQGTISHRLGIVAARGTGEVRAVGEATPHPDLGQTDPELVYQGLIGGDPTPEGQAMLEWLELDETARKRARPVASLLVPEPAVRVAVNAVVGIDAGPDRAVAAVAGGQRTLKVKVAGVPDDVAERLTAIRRAVGPDITLRADANGTWDVRTARRMIELVTHLDLEYLEDPVADDGWPGLAGSPVSLAADDNDPSDDVLTVASYIVLKPVMVQPATVMETIERVRDHHAEVVVTSVIDGAVGVGVALQVAAASRTRLACGLATSSLLAADVGDPPPIRDGSMELDRPGVGVVLDPRRLAEVAVTSFESTSRT